MNKNDVPEIYDEDYAQKYNKKFIFSDCHADFEEAVLRSLLNELGNEAKWLDVACGTGYFLSRFPNIKRCGLDISPAMLDVARKDNPEVSFVEGDFKDKYLQWENQWDLVSCMWWAYSYVESLPELERVIGNLARWTSEQGILFLPVGTPEDVTVGEASFPHTIDEIGVYGGKIKLEGIIWTWIDEDSNKQHLHLIAPHLEYLSSLVSQYFDRVDIIDYPSFKTRKAIVARCKKKQAVSAIGSDRPNNQSNALSLFSKSTRISNWWNYKIPPLLGTAYALLLLGDYTVAQAITTLALIIITSIGAAGYGHFINDIWDIEADRQANKPNAASKLKLWQRLLLCLLFITTGFAAPLLTHLGTVPNALLVLNYLLPTLYSAPPLRLKERGIWGILSDAAGAHLIPTLFVAATFLSFTPEASPKILIFTGLAAAHAFFVGLRGILLHQLWDRDNDEKSGTTTFVSQRQPETVRRWIAHFVFPIEIALLVSVAVILSLSEPSLIPFFVAYFVFTIAKLKATKTPLDPSPTVRKNIVPHDLYEVWLPLALAMLLSSGNPYYLGFVTLTLVLFFPSVKNRLLEIVNVFKTFLVADNSPPKIVSETEARSDDEQEAEDTNDDETQVSKANVNTNIKNQIVTNVSPLTPEMQRQLETEGYVIIEDFLTTTELQNLRDIASNDLVPDNTYDVSTYTLFSQNDPSFRQHHNNRLKTIVNAKLSTIIPGYRTAFCTWYIKSPNSSTNTTPLHQDPSLTAEPHTLGFGIWCPLIDVDPDNGCLHVVKGSHNLNAQPRPFYPFSPFPYNDDIATLITDHYLTHIPLKAGQAILYDKRLFHGATANPTAVERVAFTCLICRESQPTQFVYRSNPNSQTVKIYEVEDDFYNRYIFGEKPDGNGVKLIGTEDYTYDPITPEIIAEVLEPLHQETSTNNSLVTTQTPSSIPTTQQQKTQPRKAETEWYQEEIDDEMEVSKANVKNNIKNQIVTNLSPLTPEMQRQLETEGYVVLDNFLSEAELQELRDFDRVHPLPDDMASSDASVTSLTSDLSYRQKLGGKFKKIVTPKLAKLIPHYRFVFSLWFRKKPNSKNNSITLHQDPSFTDELQYLSLGIWCSLNDVDIEKSCLCVVKGSHKLNSHRRSYFISHGFPYDQTVLSCMEDNYLTPIPLKAGQAILFDKRLFHGSPPNVSNIERVAATCFSLLPQDAPLYFYYRESKKADQLEIYEVEDDFYDNYIWGEKPHGNGVKLIGTEDYTYDPITPQIIAEVLEPLHQETPTNNSLVTTQTPNSMPTTQQQKKQPTKTETEWYQDLQYIQEQAQKDNQQLQAHLEEVKTELQNTQSELQTSKSELQNTQSELQTSQTELAQSQSELKTSKTQLAKHNSDLQYTQTQLSQIQFQLQQTQTKLTQSQSQLQTTQTELVQLKTYLQQTQGEEGLINYYRSRIASNPDDIELYHQALTIKPDDGQIHVQLGNALVRQNRFDDAIASYQTALQFHPENFEIYLELAKTFEKQNQYEQAITSYRQAIELNPDNALAYKCLGDILAEIGQLSEATTSYRRALQLQPRT